MPYAPGAVYLGAHRPAGGKALSSPSMRWRNQNAMRISTGMLNSLLADATARVQPPTDKGRRLKVSYITQIGVKPPPFVLFCNDARLFHFSYQRYLENQLRAVFGFEGTPIKLIMQSVEGVSTLLVILGVLLLTAVPYILGCSTAPFW